MEDYNRTEASKCLEKSDTLLLLLFQISVTLVSDICNTRFRYLKRSSQISISYGLDITKSYSFYDPIL